MDIDKLNKKECKTIDGILKEVRVKGFYLCKDAFEDVCTGFIKANGLANSTNISGRERVMSITSFGIYILNNGGFAKKRNDEKWGKWGKLAKDGVIFIAGAVSIKLIDLLYILICNK